LEHAKIWFDSPFEQQGKKRTRKNNRQPAQHQPDEAKMKRGLTVARDMVRQHWKEAIRFDSSSEQRKNNPLKQQANRTTPAI
jgi:hypothetical protein